MLDARRQSSKIKSQIATPTKPNHIKPADLFTENLNNYIIVDNNVLVSQINIDGFRVKGIM
jgi:hypothetical protein